MADEFDPANDNIKQTRFWVEHLPVNNAYVALFGDKLETASRISLRHPDVPALGRRRNIATPMEQQYGHKRWEQLPKEQTLFSSLEEIDAILEKSDLWRNPETNDIVGIENRPPPGEPRSTDLPTDTTLQLPGKGGPSGSVLESMEGYTRLQEIRSRERDQPSKRPLQKLISGKVPSGILNALRRGPGHTKIAMAAYDAATAAWDLLSKAQQEEVIRQVYPPLPQESEEESYIPDEIISLIHAAAKQDREPGEFINTLIKRDLIEDTKIIRKAANKHFEDGVWLRDQGGKAAGGFIDRPLYDRAV